MMLINKNILLISPEPWDHIFVSKHHYAIHLAARGNNVFFLNPPVNQTTINATDFDNVLSINYNGFVKGIRFLPHFIQRWLMLKKYNQLQFLCKVKFDIVWSFDNSVFYDFDALPKSILKICHIVDLNQNFQTKKAAKTADICFAVSAHILQRLKEYQPNTFFINHGYNASRIEETNQIALPGNNKIKALYSGNLSMAYLDWKVLYDVTANNLKVDFIFIGPFRKDFNPLVNSTHDLKEKCSKLNNTYFIGKLASEKLQNWYRRIDILLISYQEKYHTDQANPHKMMEYLASGKVIIATWTDEYKNRQDLLEMVEENSSFENKFIEVTQNLLLYNDAKKQKLRKDFAFANTYSRQIERIESYLK